eukprot:m.306125 g.306125  ORF g.306125 m.306125 type:complete len:1174 (-) comp15917_c0_seq3:835-4356(-)
MASQPPQPPLRSASLSVHARPQVDNASASSRPRPPLRRESLSQPTKPARTQLSHFKDQHVESGSSLQTPPLPGRVGSRTQLEGLSAKLKTAVTRANTISSPEGGEDQRLTVCDQVRASLAETHTFVTVTLELNPGQGVGVGLHAKSAGKDTGFLTMTISKLIDKGGAAQSQEVDVGDVIVGVGDEQLLATTDAQTVGVLSKCQGKTTLHLARRKDGKYSRKPSSNDLHTATPSKQPEPEKEARSSDASSARTSARPSISTESTANATRPVIPMRRTTTLPASAQAPGSTDEESGTSTSTSHAKSALPKPKLKPRVTAPRTTSDDDAGEDTQALKGQVATLQRDNDALQTELLRISSQLKATTATTKEDKAALDTAIATLQQQLEAESNAKVDLEAQVTELKGALESAMVQMKEHLDGKTEAATELDSALEAKQDLELSVMTLEREVEALQKKLDAAEVQDRERAEANVSASTDAVQSAVQPLEARIQALVTEKDAAENRVVELEATHKAQIDNLLQKHKVEVDGLVQQHQDALAAVEGERDTASKRADDAEKALQELKVASAQATERRRDSDTAEEAAAAAMQVQIKRLEGEVSALQSKLSAAQKEVATVQQQQSQQDTDEKDKLAREITSLKASVSDMSRQLSAAKQEAQAKTDEITKLKSELLQAKQSVLEKSKEVQTSKATPAIADKPLVVAPRPRARSPTVAKPKPAPKSAPTPAPKPAPKPRPEPVSKDKPTLQGKTAAKAVETSPENGVEKPKVTTLRKPPAGSIAAQLEMQLASGGPGLLVPKPRARAATAFVPPSQPQGGPAATLRKPSQDKAVPKLVIDGVSESHTADTDSDVFDAIKTNLLSGQHQRDRVASVSRAKVKRRPPSRSALRANRSATVSSGLKSSTSASGGSGARLDTVRESAIRASMKHKQGLSGKSKDAREGERSSKNALSGTSEGGASSALSSTVSSLSPSALPTRTASKQSIGDDVFLSGSQDSNGAGVDGTEALISSTEGDGGCAMVGTQHDQVGKQDQKQEEVPLRKSRKPSKNADALDASQDEQPSQSASGATKRRSIGFGLNKAFKMFGKRLSSSEISQQQATGTGSAEHGGHTEEEVRGWDTSEVCTWLASLNGGDLVKYISSFQAKGVDGEKLLTLPHHDALKEVGVSSIGHRTLLKKAILALKA